MTKSVEPTQSCIAALTALAEGLRGTNLQPSPEVNALFGRLVELCRSISPDEVPVVARELGDDIRALAAAGEANLERHWAMVVVADPSAWVRFPFLEAYRRLVLEEVAAVERHRAPPPERWAFVGAGPLPLSAVLLERRMPEAEMTYVDRDPEALAWGRKVVGALNGARTRRFVCASADDVDYSGYGVVVVAALAGACEEDKREILASIVRSGGPSVLVLARSVPAGGCELLYPRLERVPPPWRVLEETAPPASVINCTVVADRPVGPTDARDLPGSDGGSERA